MLEDDYLDVLGKAMRGRGVDGSAVQASAHASDAQWRDFMGGVFSVDLARACACELGLGEDALACHPSYHPQPLAMDGIRQLALPFGPYEVNAWWLTAGDTCVLFDAGCRAADLAAVLPGKPDAALITHGHHDHVGGVDRLIRMAVPVYAASDVVGALETSAGQSLACGGFDLEVLDVSGHFTPSLAYLVHGLEREVLVIGDALFAGSMGKTATPKLYQQALSNLHVVLDGRPDELVILPGHGPATTLGEERRSNPFLA